MDATTDTTIDARAGGAPNRATRLTSGGRHPGTAGESVDATNRRTGGTGPGDAGSGSRTRGAAKRHVDARLFLGVSGRLKEAFHRLGTVPLSAPQRARWRSRLIAITDAAHHDLIAATRQLDDYEADFSRETAT